jgi:transcriptional regulator with XRE-family HTH domain
MTEIHYNVAMKLNEKLIRVAGWRGLRQTEIWDRLVAKKVDVSKATVNNWFKGYHVPDVEKGIELCRILGITVEQLADETIEITEAELSNDPEARVDPNLRNLMAMAKRLGWSKIFDATLIGLQNLNAESSAHATGSAVTGVTAENVSGADESDTRPKKSKGRADEGKSSGDGEKDESREPSASRPKRRYGR